MSLADEFKKFKGVEIEPLSDPQEWIKQEPIPDDVDLEQLLDEAIEETKILEQLEDEMTEQVTNNILFRELVETQRLVTSEISSLNHTLINSKREELIVDNKIFRAIEKGNDVIAVVNDKYSKTTFALMTILFVLGILFGMIDDKWLPYVGNLLDFARTATNVVK